MPAHFILLAVGNRRLPRAPLLTENSCDYCFYSPFDSPSFLSFCYLRIENAEGYVLIAVYLFIYLFVCVLFAEQKKL